MTKLLYLGCVLAFCQACSWNESNTDRCRTRDEPIFAYFTGIISSHGVLKIADNQLDADLVDVNFVIFDPRIPPSERVDAEPLIAIGGVGTCRQNILKAKFEANSADVGLFKVLGGNMTALLDEESGDLAFGYWEASLLRKDQAPPLTAELAGEKVPKVETHQGFWVEVGSKVIVDNARVDIY